MPGPQLDWRASTVPTSKDILKDAQDTLKTNTIADVAAKDILAQGAADIAAFSKAKAELATSLRSMQGFAETLEDKVKELNKGLTALRKNEAVMQAPADAKAYQGLLKDYSEAIETAMEYDKKLDAQIKKASGLV
jgi:exonuclease VII small subunit